MNHHIINNLFEFWEYLGVKGIFFTHGKDYKFCMPENMSWPSKVFGVDSDKKDFEDLYTNMKNGLLPNSLGIAEDELVEKRLLKQGFAKTSEVKGMFLNLSNENKPNDSFPSIHKVDTQLKAIEFAKIASESFGYKINTSTITPLLNDDSKIRLYLGSHEGSFVSCGIIFLDTNRTSGIHMIGTIPEHRGHGLGKIMTLKLIAEAFKNKSDTAVLVASQSGERIYTKIGFVSAGGLKSYSVAV
ncbi:MAG: GNAT family N-acetyltransferase [Allomuricauda sp.]